MAKIDQKAYMAIEEAAALIVNKAVQTFARSSFSTVRSLVKEGKYVQAYAEAAVFDLSGTFRKLKPKLEEVFVNALLFGQQQLVPVSLTALSTGKMKVPPFLDQAIEMYKRMIEVDLAESIRTSMIRFIGEEELKDDTTPITKAEEWLHKAAFTINAPDEVENYVKAGVEVRANLITTRLVNYGFLSQAKESKVEMYQISEQLDSRICPVCTTMHGKKFSVGQQMSRLEAAFSESDPEVLRQMMPWPKNTKAEVKKLRSMSTDELSSRGYDMPPYHPLCRGMLVKTGTVEQVIEIEAPMETVIPESALPKAPAEVLNLNVVLPKERMVALNDLEKQLVQTSINPNNLTARSVSDIVTVAGYPENVISEVRSLYRAHAVGGVGQKAADDAIWKHLVEDTEVGQAMRVAAKFERDVFNEWGSNLETMIAKEVKSLRQDFEEGFIDSYEDDFDVWYAGSNEFEIHQSLRDLSKNPRLYRKGSLEKNVQSWTLNSSGANIGGGVLLNPDASKTFSEMIDEGFEHLGGLIWEMGAQGEREVLMVRTGKKVLVGQD